MTFKHTKFEDSVTMRSLEKVAKDKGWVKQEDMIKSAAPQIDLTPSGVLSIDILKLCSGLRHNGFGKYADEIELKFVNYKKAAASLYDTTGETGEDLVDTAHPKGSHKMEDVAGDATFHTIVDKHLKMISVVNKEPKGKLANNKDILGAVKTVLGESFLEKGNARSTYKLAQDTAQPAPRSNTDLIGAGLAGGALTQAVPAAGKAGYKAVKDFAGKQVAKQVGKGTLQVGKDGLLDMPKSPGIWSRLSAIGGTEITGTAGVVGSAVAVVASAIIGGLIGYHVFENKFYEKEISQAYKNLLSEIDDLSPDQKQGPINGYINELKSKMNSYMEAIGPAMALVKSPSEESLKALDAVSNDLTDMITAANNIRGWANNKKGYENETSKSWLGDAGSMIWNPMDFVQNIFGTLHDIELAAANLINVGTTASSEVRGASNKVFDIIKPALAQKNNQTVTDAGASKLSQDYKSALDTINQYKSIIQAKRLPNVAKLNSWLDSLVTYIQEEQSEFDKVAPANKSVVAKEYSNRYTNEIMPRINGFKTKWIT